MTPYRGGPPSHPREPRVTLWQAFRPILPLGVGLTVIAGVGQDYLPPWAPLVQMLAIGLVLIGVKWMRQYGEAHGRREQHEAWLRVLGQSVEARASTEQEQAE